MENNEVQDKIRALMKTMEWTEYKLAQKAGLPQSTITHLFNRNNAPKFATIEAICRAFNITVSQFFADEGEAVVLTEEQRKHLIAWGALTDFQREIIANTIGQFVKA